jgi:PAS domain S-box-containing protein
MNARTKIIIVDDDPAILNATRRTLEAAGYETLGVRDGVEALRAIREHKPDLVLLDVDMPEMDGFEVCRQIKTDEALAGIYIIIISGVYTDSGSKVEGLDLGADGYITRPISNRELVARVQAMLRIQAAESALRKSEGHYRQLIEQATDGIFIINGKGDFALANSKTCEMLGYSLSELLQINILDTYIPELRHFGEQRLATLRGNEDLRFERPMRRKDGTVIIVEASAVVLADGSIQSIIRDITDRKRAEEALVESERFLNETQAISKVGGWQYDVQQNRVTWTHEVYQIYKVKKDFDPNNIEKAINFYMEEDQQIIERAFDSAIHNGQPYDLELQFVAGDGSHKWVRTIGNPVIRNGEVIKVVGNIVDITDRKSAEEAIRESEMRFRTVVESAPEGIFIQTGGCFGYTNPTAVQLFGAASPEDLLGKSVLDRFHPDYRAQEGKRIRQLNEELQPVSLDEEVILKLDDTPVAVEVSAVPFQYQNQQGALVFIRDIFERKQAEAALRMYSENLEHRVEERTRELHDAQEKLFRQEKLALLGQLASSVGHELRNPLGIISNAIYYLRMVQADADAQVKEYLSIIDSETRIADNIITDLLDFSRVIIADREATFVSDLVKRTLERYPSPDSIPVTVHLREGLPMIFVDPRQLVQVLGNLVVNAYQAMPQGGTLTILAEQKEAEIVIAVEDCGVGISEENLARLFEPLFTTKPKGIGLGLAVSRKLVEANGGRIEVHSELRKGSTFTVLIPVERPTKSRRRKPHEPNPENLLRG